MVVRILNCCLACNVHAVPGIIGQRLKMWALGVMGRDTFFF